MIVNKVTVQNTTIVLPSIFVTSTEFAPMLKASGEANFNIIPPKDFTPALMVERTGNKLAVKQLTIAKVKKVFDNKITSHKAQTLPENYVFHFNVDGKVLGVKSSQSVKLALHETQALVMKTKLTMVPYILVSSKMNFIYTLLDEMLKETKDLPWDGTLRIGFHIGDSELRHTNKIIMPGVVATIIPPASAIRIRGIFKHAPDYAETVLWFELKQYAPSIYEVLKEEDFRPTFMENLIRCL